MLPAETPLAAYLAGFADADAVAAACRVKGVTGRRNNCYDCAFARLLVAAGFTGVSVDEADIKANRAWVVQPDPVHEFVTAFDAGRYPDLVETPDARA